MDNKKKSIPFAVWGEVTGEKIKKAIENKEKAEIQKQEIKKMLLKEDESNNKDKLLQVRVSNEYHQQLRKAALENGINISELVRQAVEQYIPLTITKEEKEKKIKKMKNHCMAQTIFAITNTTNGIKEKYNYEPSFILPEEEILIKMFDDEIFNNLKLQALNYIIYEIDLGNKLDKRVEETVKSLIKIYMSK